MNSVEELAELFKQFPGVGRRQAKRFVYFLLREGNTYRTKLAESITLLEKTSAQCGECFRYFPKDTQDSLCSDCARTDKDRSLIMVVEKDMDRDNVAKLGIFSGTFFVLGGLLALFEEEPEKKIRVRELLEVVTRRSKAGVLNEVILAFSANAEGETTARYISKALSPISEKSGFSITVLGRGLSTGTELEYLDADTLQNALKNRG